MKLNALVFLSPVEIDIIQIRALEFFKWKGLLFFINNKIEFGHIVNKNQYVVSEFTTGQQCGIGFSINKKLIKKMIIQKLNEMGVKKVKKYISKNPILN
jgi:hypothetical protein